MSPARMPSSHQWLPVTMTAYIVSAGCTRISQRHRRSDEAMTATATTIAQPTWIDGRAASWLDSPLPPAP